MSWVQCHTMMSCNIRRSQLRFCPSLYNSITTRALIALGSKRKPRIDSGRLIHTRNLPSRKGSKSNSKPSQSTSIAQSNAVPYQSLETRLAKRGLPTLLYQASSYRSVYISQSVLFMIDLAHGLHYFIRKQDIFISHFEFTVFPSQMYFFFEGER